MSTLCILLSSLLGILPVIFSTPINPVVFYQNDERKPESTTRYDHYKQLDASGHYWLFWTTNETHITFEAHVKTMGYVGIGLSPNGKMYPSDVMVGWVDETGQAYVYDYHTTGHSRPILDDQQDWELIQGTERENGTVLTFVRKLDTCDNNDRPITDDTARVIYAYHDTDPLNATHFQYHGSDRGARSIVFLSRALDEENIFIPNDTKTFDFVADKFHVPAKQTTYNCRIFRFPELDKKHHMIKYEPIVQSGNEMNVHHILIFTCRTSTNLTRFIGKNYECHSSNPLVAEGTCIPVLVAWAIGGEAFYYPQNSGVSLGTDKDSNFYLLETHYDNPSSRADIVDSSGIRIYYTPTLRYYDVGTLMIGLQSTKNLIVPPLEKQFLSQGYCPANTIKNVIPPGGMKIFAVFQHSHLLGRALKTRHIRNGKELKPIAEDEHYDFNYQYARILKQERIFLPGDSLEMDCIYDSSDKQQPTFGGYSTREEMCLSFLLYYPKIDLDYCMSSPTYNAVVPRDDIRHGSLLRYINSVNWTDPNEHYRFHDALHISPHSVLVLGQGTPFVYAISQEPEPTITTPYQKPPSSC